MMRRAWDWYRARRWWWKALLGAPVALVAFAVLFLVARALQYRSASRVAAGEYVPEGAQVVVRLPDAARQWSRIQSTDFWKALRTKLLRDPAVRREINAALKEAGVGGRIEDFDDRRTAERTHGLLTEDTLLRIMGRDAMVALRFADSARPAGFCAATRLGFWDYAIAPFASWVLPSESIAGTRCYKFGSIRAAVVGAIAVASDDKALLASALRRRGRALPGAAGLSVSVSFEDSTYLDGLRHRINAFPQGGFMLFTNGDALTRADVTLDVDGADLVVDARLEGMPALTPDAPVDAVRFVPASGAGAIALPFTGEQIWTWGTASSSQEPTIAEAMKLLAEAKFADRVPTRLRGPVTMLLGSSVGAEGKTFASCALVLRSDDPAAVDRELRAVIDELIRKRGGQEKVALISQMVHERTVWAFDYGGDPFKYNDYLRPCWTVHGDAFIVANSLPFLMAVIATAQTAAPTMADEEFYASAQRRLDKLGVQSVLREGSLSSAFVHGPALREGLEGFWPILADKRANNPTTTQSVRAELETEWRKQGRNPAGTDFVLEFNAVMRERVSHEEKRLRDLAKVLDYVRFVAGEIDRDDSGLRARGVLELKSPSP